MNFFISSSLTTRLCPQQPVEPIADSEDEAVAVLNEPTEDEAADEVVDEALDGALTEALDRPLDGALEQAVCVHSTPLRDESTRACLGLSPRELTRDVMRLFCRCFGGVPWLHSTSPSPVVSYILHKQ